MTSEQKRQQINVLIKEAEEQDDPRAVIQLIRNKITELNNLGEEIPEELIWMQKRYTNECIYASQNR